MGSPVPMASVGALSIFYGDKETGFAQFVGRLGFLTS